MILYDCPMNYARFLKKLELPIRFLIYLLTIGVVVFVIWQNVKPSVSFVYNFPKMPSIHSRGPVDKFNKPYSFYTSNGETFLKISRAQAFFEINLPSEFEKISFEIVHQNQNQLELNLQVPKNREEFLRLPLYNAVLQQAENWNKVDGNDDWILLQRPETQVHQYTSIDKFLQKPPMDRQILVFEDIYSQFAPFVESENLKIEKYNEATTLNNIDYIFARYDIPEQTGQWMVSYYTINLPEEERQRGALYKFHLEAYGVEESESLVRAIKITLLR